MRLFCVLVRDRLTDHLAQYLGAWPPTAPIDVVASAARRRPEWDGARFGAVAVRSPSDGTLVSVRPDRHHAAAASVADLAVLDPDDLAAAVGSPARVSPWLVLRWSEEPADLPDDGTWVETDHPALPDWLRAFPGPVLAAFDGDGAYLAGVGIKPHSSVGKELAVGTAEAARGRGLGRRVVAQAARAVIAGGGVPLYVHHPDNVPSAKVADAAGFPDRGWRMLVVWEG